MSEGKPGIALNDLHSKLRSFTSTPQESSMPGAIQERASVRPFTALERTGDTNELGFERMAGNLNNCVTVPTHIHEGNVR